jgi:hypothetical protein
MSPLNSTAEKRLLVEREPRANCGPLESTCWIETRSGRAPGCARTRNCAGCSRQSFPGSTQVK